MVFRSLKREFVPPEDKGWFFNFVIAPEGSSLAYTDGYQRQAEAMLAKTKGVESYFSVVNLGDGVSRGMIFTNLEDWSKRKRSVQDIIDEVQPQFFGIPGVFAFANNPPAFGFGSPVNFVIQHPDFDSAGQRQRHAAGPGAADRTACMNVDSDLRVNKPRARRWASIATVRKTWACPWATSPPRSRCCWAAAGPARSPANNKQYDVIVQLDPRARATPSDMTGLYVRGRERVAGQARGARDA